MQDLISSQIMAQQNLLIAALIVVVIAASVLIALRARTKRARLEVMQHYWREQQEIGRIILSSDETMAAYEKLVYGAPPAEPEEARVRLLTLLLVNRVWTIWQAKRLGLIGRKDLAQEIDVTLASLKRREKAASHMVAHRGYPKLFQRFFLKKLSAAKPVESRETEFNADFEQQKEEKILRLLDLK